MSSTLAPTSRPPYVAVFPSAVVFLVFLMFALRAFAGQATLAWDASPDARVTGYNVHYGLQSGTYSTTYPAGNAKTVTVAGLTEGQTYYFVVRARDAAGTESANSNQVAKAIPYAAPTASIAATPTSGTAPLATAFSSTMTGVTSYTWNFGDNVISANVQNPSHTYTVAGNYTASLTATGPGGTVVKSQTIAVTAPTTTNQAPESTILSPSANLPPAAPGATVYFQGSGSDPENNKPYTFLWNFGDATTSTLQNPPKSYSTAGTYIAKLTVKDAKGLADPTPATVTVTVKSATTPQPPVAVADRYTVVAGKTLSIAAPGVLSNDTSPSGKALTASLVATTTNGTLSLASNGAFTFTPAAGFVGTTAFSYKVSDGTNTSAAATSAIVVTAMAPTSSASAQTLWPATAGPTNPSGQDSRSVNLGVKFTASQAGYISGIRYYKSTANTGKHVATLWSSTGSMLATAPFANETPAGWQEAIFAKPVPISANTVYVASYFAPNGHYAFDKYYFASKGVDSGALHALSNAVNNQNGVYAYSSTTTFPASSYLATNYWVDVVYKRTE